MEVGVWKQSRHFSDERVEKLVSFFLRDLQSSSVSRDPARRIRSRLAGQFGVADDHGPAVSRHFKLGNDADAAITRISHELTNFRLRVVLTLGSHLVQLGKFLAFDAKS